MKYKDKIQVIINSLEPKFLEAQEAYETFKKNWDEQFSKVGLEYKSTDLYNSTLNKFNETHNTIGNVILPIITELKSGNTTNIDTALAYLAVPIRHFRSGYFKEKICKALKKLDLTSEQVEYLKEVFHNLSPVKSRELHELSRLIQTIS